MRALKAFDTWANVLAYGRQHGSLLYKAPMDHRAVTVRTPKGGTSKRLRIIPPAIDCDPFWADEGHLDRMFYYAETCGSCGNADVTEYDGAQRCRSCGFVDFGKAAR